MLLLAQGIALVAATLLMFDGHSGGGGVFDNQPGLQFSPASNQFTAGQLRGRIFDCDYHDSYEGSCWFNDRKQRDSRLESSCGSKGKAYNFVPPLIGGQCYCYRCQY